MTAVATTCPTCGQSVRPVWPTCRSCGTLLMAAPAPVVPIGTPVEPAPGTSPEEQFFAPAVLQPTFQTPPAAPPVYTHSPRIAGSGSGVGKWITLVGMVVFVIAAVATAWFSFGGKSSTAHQTPEVLAPRAPTAGLPTSLDVIVRVEAESARHTALQTVEQVGSGNIGQLSTMQPDYQWVAGDQPSTTPHDVSVAQAQGGGTVTIAVAASNHDVCAFGQWTPNGAAQYVTMAHETTCAAVNAPSSGWSSQPGGAASDLPDDNG